MQTNKLFVICRLRNDGQVAPEASTSVINSMFTAMRSGISAVSRRIGIPQALRKMLEGEVLISTVVPSIRFCQYVCWQGAAVR